MLRGYTEPQLVTSVAQPLYDESLNDLKPTELDKKVKE